MFGLIVAGRLVSTNWEQISPTNVVSEITDADAVNHLVVFLTGIRLVSSNQPSWSQLSHVQDQNPSRMASAEPCISVGPHLQGENRPGNSWEPSTTRNPQRYSG